MEVCVLIPSFPSLPITRLPSFVVGITLKTDFVVNSVSSEGNSWTARIQASSKENSPISLIFYFYNEGRDTLKFTANPSSHELENVSGNFSKVSEQ